MVIHAFETPYKESIILKHQSTVLFAAEVWEMETQALGEYVYMYCSFKLSQSFAYVFIYAIETQKKIVLFPL